MATRPFFHSCAALLAMSTATMAYADADTSARMQLLFIGADPTEGTPGPLPADMPILTMNSLPLADGASQEVFAALLRSNPVSTFVTTPSAGEAQFEQFFLVTDIAISTGDAGLEIALADETYSTDAFSTRLSALVDAFNPEHRRIAFVRVSDPGNVFPVSMSDLQTAIGAAGFDVMVVMIGNGAPQATCTTDASRAIHYPVITGVADRAPFGNGDGTSTTAEVDDFVRDTLHRATMRDANCGPKYSIIVKSGGSDDAPLVSHAGLPGFTELETQLYHETFDALFLMESTEQASLQSFLNECLYCPNEAALTDRLQSMREYELLSQMESEVWTQISDDTTPVRLEIYLENCTLCSFRDEAEARISLLNAKDAAQAEEAEAFGAAMRTRDLAALRGYVESCVACVERENAARLIAEIEADTAYQEERALLETALASGRPDALQAYLNSCTVCDGQDDAQAMLTETIRRAELSQPCFSVAGLPQMGGPRKLEDIDQSRAQLVCSTALAEFPEDPALMTMLGRIKHAAGDIASARTAYRYGVENDVPAAFGLAAYTYYAPTDGAELDMQEAERLAASGADHGDWLSQELLTVMYSKNLVPGKDAGDAFAIAASLADEGNALAQFFVGYFYLTGSGVNLDEESAVAWLDQSVDQGYVHAYSFLAELHEQGRGTALAPEKAADLYWNALLKGDPTARERLTTQLSARHEDVVRFVQERLSDEGAFRGQIDGIAGPSTVSAIRTFAETLSENT